MQAVITRSDEAVDRMLRKNVDNLRLVVQDNIKLRVSQFLPVRFDGH